MNHWNTHGIDASNTVNGKPVRYLRNLNGAAVPSGAGQIILANCTNTAVENQNVSNGSVGVQLGFSSNVTVRNTTSSGNVQGMYLYDSSNNTIESSIFSANQGHGLYLQSSVGNTILNNTAIYNKWGIYLLYSDGNTIENNKASLNDWNGMYIAYSSRNTLQVNNVSSNVFFDGFELRRSDENTLTNNTVNGNRNGIRLTSSDNNTIISNQVSHGRNDGIRISSSSNNTLANNTLFLNNGQGIHFTSSIDNKVFHNNFVDNSEQAYDDSAVNQWDDGYPSGGNYWSDYAGTDLKSGVNQDIPGSDGLGDLPYDIDMSNQDGYPLMTPTASLPPRPPIVLYASLSGLNFENVEVKWSPSQDDGMGFRSVVRYEINKNTTYNVQGVGYVPDAIIPNGTTEFIDSLAGEGDPENYFYQICAVDVNNNTSCADNQAAKFTRPLSKGPNLISIPLIQSDESLQTVFQTLSYDNAWSYDPINQDWRSFSKSKPYAQSLEYLNHTMGIWVNVTQDSNLTVAGVVPTSTTIDLQAGWNLVGFPSFDDSFTVADLKAVVAVERIEGYDALAPPYFLRVMNDGDFLQAGFGYWIRVQSPAIWTVENT